MRLRALEESVEVMPSRKLTCGSGAVNAGGRARRKNILETKRRAQASKETAATNLAQSKSQSARRNHGKNARSASAQGQGTI